MKEAQKLERSLQEKIDTTIRVPIVFSYTDEIVADKGDTIGRKHVSTLTKAVQAYVDKIESDLKEKLDRSLERIKEDVDKSKAEADEEMVQLRAQLEDRSDGTAEKFGEERDELMSLQPMMFLGESKYRELKQKWGQVFKADMGAEAFYDILRRLDLEQLGKELWHEVRTTKSKQKKKKAIKRLKVVEALRRSGNRPEWMILTMLPVHPARSAPDGAVGRRPVCHVRPERPVPARDQPQQPPQAAAGAGRAGCHRAQREAHAAGSGRLADRQQPARQGARRAAAAAS